MDKTSSSNRRGRRMMRARQLAVGCLLPAQLFEFEEKKQ